MAKKARSQRAVSGTRTRSAPRTMITPRSRTTFWEKMRDVYDNPAVRYIAGGIAAAALTKVIAKLSTDYPEITNALRGGLDSIENKLVEFRGGAVNETDSNMGIQH